MVYSCIDLENNIDRTRDKLNQLMANNYSDNYEEVLQVSVELDKLIYILLVKYTRSK